MLQGVNQSSPHQRGLAAARRPRHHDKARLFDPRCEFIDQCLTAKEAIGVFFSEIIEAQIRAAPVKRLGLESAADLRKERADLFDGVTDDVASGKGAATRKCDIPFDDCATLRVDVFRMRDLVTPDDVTTNSDIATSVDIDAAADGVH